MMSTVIDAKVINELDANCSNNCEKIFRIILDDWMFGYKTQYQLSDYDSLLKTIQEFKHKKIPLKFLLPAFPCKSNNVEEKVSGVRSDFAEFQAIKNILTAVKKIDAEYEYGVDFTIMSDYHTFDKYIGVSEDDFKVYEESLRKIIKEVAAKDFIKLISLKDYEIFKDTPENKLSDELLETFGDKEFMNDFEKNLKDDENFFNQYRNMRSFMMKDQKCRLPGTKKSKVTSNFLRGIVRGMMNNGVALSRFLKIYNPDIVRMSIHNHNPNKGIYTMDLFKLSRCGLTTPSTPWHNVICYDARKSKYIVAHKEEVESQESEKSCLLEVRYNGHVWFFILVNTKKYTTGKLQDCLEISMTRGNAGIIIETKMPGMNANIIESSSIFSLLKEFGVIVLRGFGAMQSTILDGDLALVDDDNTISGRKVSLGQRGFIKVECINASESNANEIKNRFSLSRALSTVD